MYCSHCGNELEENEKFCSKCGQSCEAESAPNNSENPFASNAPNPFAAPFLPTRRESGISTAAKILMILGTIGIGISTFLIGLAWAIPMTVHYFNSIKFRRPIGTGFKICSLLFVNTIAGILMLCDNEH